MDHVYEELVLPVIGTKGKKENYYLNKVNVNYHRPYVEDKTNDKMKTKSALFMRGSTNMLIVDLPPYELSRRLAEEKISLAGLSPEERDLIKRLIESYHKERSENFKSKGA